LAETNPLLDSSIFPRFDAIQPQHIRPAVELLLREASEQLERLEREAPPSWPGLIEPLEELSDRVQRPWGVVGHLLSVCNSPELRAAHEALQPDVVRFWMRLSQSVPLYERLRELRDSTQFAALDSAQRRIVALLIRDAELAGVGLGGDARERFTALSLELAEIGTRFSNHVLDSTRAFALVLREPDEVAGLPRSLLERAADAERRSGEAGCESADADTGPWRITLDYPSALPFLQYSERRELRERVFRARLRRASEGDTSNESLIGRILALRREQASLLGFSSYAALSLASKMAPDVAAVERLLEELRAASFEPARAELEELRELARAAGAPEAEDFAPWDVAFWAERLREQRFDYSDEELRPYFPLPRVLDGLFALAQRLFGIHVVADDGAVPVWHPDVRFFRVQDEQGEPIASFYMDPYSRPAEKRGGAWVNECVGRRRLAGHDEVQPPVGYLICNSSAPVGDRPSLLTFDEVETLFHEFGHALQHMLTRVDYGFASGFRNVEWDAVELPSQFMENWCYHRPTILGLSGHVETGEPLPDALFEKLDAARTFRAASAMLRQLSFALVDLELHHAYDPEAESPFAVQRRVAERTEVLPPLADDRFLCSFEHIFAGGYAAGYYSYKWAEVLSADAFSAFEEAGLDREDQIHTIGRRFRDTVLALGGSVSPAEVFRSFRGRDPSTEPLLRHAGLTPA